MAKKQSASAKPAPGPKAATDMDVLKQLVELLEQSSATSIKLSRGDASYEVSRGLGGVVMPAPMAHHHAPHAATPASPAVPPVAAPAPPVSNLVDIKSPMVGTHYRSPEPGVEPYVKVGTRIAPGQTLCIIEAMKIMNELESEVSGTVREILVEDAQPVEFGQVLFRVEP